MRNVMLISACLVVASGIVSVSLWQKLQQERALNARLQARLEAAGIPVPVAAPSVRPADEGSTQPNTGAPVLPPAMEAAEAAEQADRRFSEQRRRQWSDPEYRSAFLAQQRLEIARRHPGLIEKLGITPEDGAKVFDILAQRELDSRSRPDIDGLSEESMLAAAEEHFGEINRRRDEALTMLLGSARLEQFEEYEQERPSWMQLAEASQAMTSMNMPMSPEQSSSLLRTLLAEQKRMQQQQQQLDREFGGAQRDALTMTRRLEAGIDQATERNRRTVESARGYLNSWQLEALKAALDKPLEQLRAQVRAGRAQLAIQGR